MKKNCLVEYYDLRAYIFPLRYFLSNGTASSSDFTFQDSENGKLIFKPGEILKSISVQIVNNTKPEMNESFALSLNSDDDVTNVPAEAVQIFILDDGEYKVLWTVYSIMKLFHGLSPIEINTMYQVKPKG